MNLIPITIVDNFLHLPNQWVDFANSCQYHKAKDGWWPGERSDLIKNLNLNLHEKLCERYFSLFFDCLNTKPFDYDVKAFFQKIDKNTEYGWVHYDLPFLMTAIIYLTENNVSDNGTSIYNQKAFDSSVIWQKEKHLINLGIKSAESGKQFCDENNQLFEETVNIKNKFNRMITFDASLPHKANLENIENERLTLVMFIDSVGTNKLPIYRKNVAGI